MRCCEQGVDPSSILYKYDASATARAGLLYLCYAGDYTYLPGFDLVRDNFDCYLLGVILEGSMIFETEGQTFVAGRDDIVLIDCHRPHRYASESGSKLLWVHFDGLPAKAYYDWICASNGNVFALRDVGKLEKCLRRLYNMLHLGNACDEAQMHLQLSEALTVALHDGNAAAMGPYSSIVEDVVLYINSHLDEDISVAQLAKMAALSEYYFIRIFSREMGQTPHQYLISARLDYARYLLKTTTLTVQQVAGQIGYDSESMFCAAFKSKIGLTPTQYRRNGTKGD